MRSVLPCCLALLGLLHAEGIVAPVQADMNPDKYWKVEDVRAGMKGEGRTVMKGTKVDRFQAEVIGVLHNVSPGRDLVLCRLAGLNLEKTGVIAGMSGSPIYVDGKLLGAVAYAWTYGTEPIAGVTPFSQMEKYVAPYENRDLADKVKSKRVGLRTPLDVGGKRYQSVIVSDDVRDARPAAADGIYLVPLRTPLVASGFSAASLAELRDRFGDFGVVPMQGGAVPANVPPEERAAALEPGSAMSVSLISGDFDMSAIGTVTHVEGKRVYGFGHPFFGVGECDFPLSVGYVHTIFPRLSLSFKMGSPLRPVGIINADVSTCVAGWLERQADLLPVSMTVLRQPAGPARTFNVKIARQRAMLGMLTFAALANAVDVEGELPEELTAHLKINVDIEDRPPLTLHDVVSGSNVAGQRAPQALFSQVQAMINILAYNSFRPIRINRIDCTAEIHPGRNTADIEAVELDSDIYAPGDTLKALVTLRPFKGYRQRLPLTLELPADLPEGKYLATISDGLNNAKLDLRDNPNLASPPDFEHLYQSLQLQTAARRDRLVLRVPTQAVGVALAGKSLPDLPPSMVQILGQGRRTGAQNIRGALVNQQPTDWVIQGTESVGFTVSKNRRISN